MDSAFLQTRLRGAPKPPEQKYHFILSEKCEQIVAFRRLPTGEVLEDKRK
jgi:hypothetical protein